MIVSFSRQIGKIIGESVVLIVVQKDLGFGIQDSDYKEHDIFSRARIIIGKGMVVVFMGQHLGLGLERAWQCCTMTKIRTRIGRSVRSLEKKGQIESAFIWSESCLSSFKRLLPQINGFWICADGLPMPCKKRFARGERAQTRRIHVRTERVVLLFWGNERSKPTICDMGGLKKKKESKGESPFTHNYHHHHHPNYYSCHLLSVASLCRQ